MDTELPSTFKDYSRKPITVDTDNILYFLDEKPFIEEVWNVTEKDSLSIIKPGKVDLGLIDWLFSDEW